MPIVNAWGKLIQAPDDMSHEEIEKIILDNEKDLNPDYKPPKSSGVREFVQDNILGFDISRKPSIAEQAEATADEGANTAAPQVNGAPVRQSFYNKALLNDSIGVPVTERFRKPDINGVLARTRKAADEDVKGQDFQRELEGLRTDGNIQESPSGVTGLLGNVITGAKQTGRMAAATVSALANDNKEVEGIAKESNLSSEENTPTEQKALLGDLRKINREQDAFDQISDTLKSAANNPMGTGQMVAEQLPNTAVSLASGFAGFKAGGAAGAVFGPIGATIGGTLGFVSGMFLGNVLLEAGGKAIEKASDEDGFTPEDRDSALREGAVKAGVITGVDAATFKLGGMLARKIGASAINAGARAEAKVLIDAGVDATSLTAINAALKSSPELLKAAKVAGERAALQSLSTGRKAAILGTGAALETVGEFVGEAGGEYAATGKADYVDATIEALSSATMSIAETAYNYNKVASGNDLSPVGIQKAVNSINDAETKSKINDIRNAATVDQAINVANESVSQKPVDKDDVLRVADPTLADIERLTGLKPSETLQTAQEELQRQSQAAQQNIETGSDIEIVLPDNKTLKARWDVVDADNVKASLKNGVSQPRDRTRAASDVQIQEIANQPDYRRLADSPVMDIGAPVISVDGQIVGGNGRFEALSRAYDQGTHKDYLDRLKQDAINKGIDPAILDTMRKPVLVRRISEPFDTRQLAIASNSGMSAAYSDLEQAKIDAERLKGIDEIITADNGDIVMTGDNVRRVRDALGGYNAAEIASFVDDQGQLSQQGIKRIRNAMLAKAYGDNPVLGKIIESTDSDIKTILGSLTRVAGDVVKAMATAPKESDITPNLLDAINIFSQLKQKGQSVTNYLSQQDAFTEQLDPVTENVLLFLDKNSRSQPKVTQYIRDAYTKQGAIDATSPDIFGQEPPKVKDIFAKPTIEEELEKHLKKNGYDFDVRPVDQRDINALDDTKKAQKDIAEKQAKIFNKKIVFVKAKGEFGINGVMVPAIKDTIFINIETPKPFHAVMAHELSHWMEQEHPSVYKDMLGSLKDVIVNEEGYRKKYGITEQDEGLIQKEIAADLMGDNFTDETFWNKVAAANPDKWKEIAKRIIQWLKNTILKAKSRGMGSEDWVTDAKKAQDIIANAVSQYTKQQDAVGKDIKFHKAFHGSPHDHDKFDSSKIGTGEGAQAYGYGHYFADSKEVAEWYKNETSEQHGDYVFINGEKVTSEDNRFSPAVALFNNRETGEPAPGYFSEEENSIYDDLYESDANIIVPQPRLYEVELAPEQDEYLLWDKPLSEQSEKVRLALKDAPFETSGGDWYGSDLYDMASSYSSEDGRGKNPKGGSALLHSLGIRGIKYLDGSSRAKGEGAYNYVIFSDEDIQIKAKFSKQEQENKDKEYLQAVEDGDIEKAQKMVDAAARDKGYISGAEYRMMHQAPNREDYNLATIKETGIVPDDYWTHPHYYQSDATERESFNKVNSAIDRQRRTGRKAGLSVYRAVPKDIKDTNIRNGDWVTPSREYARMEGESIPGGYKIISAIPNIDNLWWDANSINELGYDDGKEYAYKNTKNNIKLIDAVTYDDDGNVIPLSKRFNSRSDDIRFSRAPKLYSKLEQALESANDKVFSTGPQVKLWLQSNAAKLGIKKDEIYWSGVDNWLDAQGKVSKQQVVEFVRQNGIKVEDVILDDSGIKDVDDVAFMEYDDELGKWVVYSQFIDGDFRTDDKSEAKQLYDSLIKEHANPTKHNNDKLTLPGGTDYKELVVTVPTIEKYNESDTTHFGDTGQGKQIGWIRMNTRNGGLFIEELQSQRAQQGRSKGFGARNVTRYEVLLDGNYWGDFNTKVEAEKAVKDAVNNNGAFEIKEVVTGRLRGVPPAPFVSDANNKATNAYITLLMKKALIEAVSNDHASVSWTTGDQQADRYDLSKQISMVSAISNKDGTYNLIVEDKSGNEINPYSRSGKKVTPSEMEEVIGKDLTKKVITGADLVKDKPWPKNASVNPAFYTVRGVDLKIGGEWAQSMYGDEQGLNAQGKPSLMTQAANDIFKHVGSGKVESINGQPGFYITPEMRNKDLPLFSVREVKPFNPNEDIPETKAQKAQRIGQDKFNRFRVIKEWLAKEKGINLSEAADVYGAEERYYGKVANQQEDFREKIRNPLIEKISKAGYKLDDVEQYLLNRHAQEANAQNRKLTGKEDSTAYGISDADAQAYLDKAPKELAKLADEAQALTDKAQQLRLDNGIETGERVNAMKSAYQYYVPVRGDAESQQKQNQYKGTGKGFSMKYKPKRRLGHELRNESVIENIFQDYERAIIQVEDNRMGKSLALMAAEINMPELISINQPVKRKVLQNQKAYGVLVKGELQDVFQTEEAAKQNRQLLVATDKKLTLSDITIAPITDQRLVYSASPMLADNEVLVYMNGHEVRLQINDELLARAYKNMGTEPLGHILSTGRAINGWMSKAYTGYNPYYILVNLLRDFQTGFANLTGEQGILIAGKAIANYPKSFASLLKYAFNGKSDKWIDAYRDNGGNTGAAYLPDLERLGEEVKREYASYQGVIANLKEGDSANALRAAGRKAFNATLKYINHLNAASENAFRLATFKAMVESGKSVNEAASMAKNVTVNFNRKGELGSELSALYLFFNPSIQGTAATSHALFKGRHKYQAWGLVGSMMTIGYMMASMLGGFDDEDKYDEISDATKSRNLIMAYGDGYLKIPIPYGYGFFYNAGRMFAEAQRKGELGKMPYQLMALAIEEFSPFNVATTEDSEFSSKKVFYGFLPTMLKIPAEITNNYSSFTNRELYPEKSWYKSEPDNEKMWRGTKGTVYDISAQYLASIGVEISPEVLKYMNRTATGGSGAFVDQVVSGAMLKSQGAELEAREIPFVNKFYGEATIQDARARYNKAKEEAREAYEKFNALRQKNDLASVKNYLKDNKELLALNDYANKLSEVIKYSRDQQDLIKLSKDLTIAEKRLKIKELEKREEYYYDLFLNRHKQVKGR